MSFNADIAISLVTTLRDSPPNILAQNIDPLSLTGIVWGLTSGAGADQATFCWHDRRILGAATTEHLDLQQLPFWGGDVDFEAIKALFVEVETIDQSPFDITVGVDTTSGAPWSSFIDYSGAGQFGLRVRSGTVSRGGGLLVTAPDATGWAVGGGNDRLSVINDNAFSVTYRIVLVGEGDWL